MHPAPLRPHPTTPCPWLREVTVQADSLTADLLVLYYRITGDIDQLRLPAQARSGPRDELWRHTCLEAFLGIPGTSVYYELNFSPSSEWAIYRFDDYRQGMTPVRPPAPPRVIFRRSDDRIEADIDVHLDGLAELKGRDLRLAAAAVLEDERGQISYWSLAHAPGKPDFHRTDGFVLGLQPGAARP